MIIKFKHGLLLAVGLLLVVCLCCLAEETNETTTQHVVTTKMRYNKTKIETTTRSTEQAIKPNLTVPTVIVDVDEFEDPWDYSIKPDVQPLLLKEAHQHDLPLEGTPFEGVLEEEPTTEAALDGIKKKIGNSLRVKMSCSTCRLGVGLLQSEVRKGSSFEEIKMKFVSICTTFKIEIEHVCSGIFDMYGPEVLPVLNRTTIGTGEICSLSVGESCGDIPNPLHEWDVEFPPTEKPLPQINALPQKGKPVFKVLQISDTHYDPKYVVGSVANCQEPLCCRADSTPPENASIPVEPAGKWGSYQKCDSPNILIDNSLEDIVKHHPDIDYILWTGDLPPHDIWNQTKEENLMNLKNTLGKFYKSFPGIPIFPALGNHESIPAGHFPPPWLHEPDHTVNWLYTELAKEWSKWLPESSENTILHGGFYSVLVRPSFRIISLNMNYCHTISWWLYLNSTDPASELQWLIYQLQEAEDHGEKVHIIGHIPPGQSDCMKVWSRNYYNIINRYEDTVVAQFFGHTHQDEYEVFYDNDNYTRPVSIAYIGPSITTFENNNPGYRIYYVDGDHNETTREVIDHETWYLDLDKANSGDGTPEWSLLYTAKAAYGMKSLRPEDWSFLTDRMVRDDELFNLFHKFYYRDSPTRTKCDTTKCKLEILCDLRSGKSHDRHHLCHKLETILTD